MQYAIYLYTILTIFGFWLALQISKRWKSMIFNTFVLTVSILVLILVVSDIPYDDYMAGNAPINNLLGVSIVALALPANRWRNAPEQGKKRIICDYIAGMSDAYALKVYHQL